MKRKALVKNFADFTVQGDNLVITPTEPLLYSNSNMFAGAYKNYSKIYSINKVILNLANQDNFDSYLIVFKNKLEKICKDNAIEFEVINLSSDIKSVIDLLQTPPIINSPPKEELSAFRQHIEMVGTNTFKILTDFYNFISFFGELFTKMLKLIFHPSRMRWEDVPGHFTQSGVMALPITIMIVFLLGLITGYQGALQLKQFGADSFIADLIGISLTRELSPLMVAILVAGRSGSAFAAELGTMKVSEEIDALTTMGFDPIEFLVLPRVFAVTLAMPLLVVICNVVGMFGGLLAALSTLDITTTGYILRMQEALSLTDIATGLIKSVIFGFLIASIGCYKGINVQGGAEQVGKFTTASVVAGVFLIILSDAVFTFIFQALGL